MEDYGASSSQEEENPAFAFTVMEEKEEGVCKVSTASNVPTMNVSINGIVQEVLIDSGSVSNLMGKENCRMQVSKGASKIVQRNCLPMVAEKLRSLASSRRTLRWEMQR